MQNTIPTISPAALNHLLLSGEPVRLIDVRSPGEFADGHAAGAESVPLARIESGEIIPGLDRASGPARSLYLICAGGARASQAATLLQAWGVDNLVLVEGGTDAWRQQKLPMQRHSRLPSLERQAQIAVGVLILLVLAKSTLLHPLFLTLGVALGIGLIASGLTARCGLTALLARMPWNRSQAGGTASTA